MILQLLAISGSLRRGSSNTELLSAAALLAAPGVAISLYSGLAELPAFNPDRELEEIAPVLDLRARLRDSAGVLFCSPEYAHGLPGALKNALDWVVGTGELSEKKVAVWNASPRSTIATAQLRETLKTMNANLIEEACFSIQLMGKQLTAPAIASDPSYSATLRTALGALARAIDESTGGAT